MNPFLLKKSMNTSKKRPIKLNFGQTAGIFIIFAFHRTLPEGQALSISLLVLISFLLSAIFLMRRGYAISTSIYTR